MVIEAMDDATRQQYLADDPPTIVPLAIKPHFEALDDKQKLYAHYISRAAFAGTRINLRQVSPESEAIFDFILTLHKQGKGQSHHIAIWALCASHVARPSPTSRSLFDILACCVRAVFANDSQETGKALLPKLACQRRTSGTS